METEGELETVKVKDEANKIISDIKEGKIKIDYETGKVSCEGE